MANNTNNAPVPNNSPSPTPDDTVPAWVAGLVIGVVVLLGLMLFGVIFGAAFVGKIVGIVAAIVLTPFLMVFAVMYAWLIRGYVKFEAEEPPASIGTFARKIEAKDWGWFLFIFPFIKLKENETLLRRATLFGGKTELVSELSPPPGRPAKQHVKSSRQGFGTHTTMYGFSEDSPWRPPFVLGWATGAVHWAGIAPARYIVLKTHDIFEGSLPVTVAKENVSLGFNVTIRFLGSSRGDDTAVGEFVDSVLSFLTVVNEPLSEMLKKQLTVVYSDVFAGMDPEKIRNLSKVEKAALNTELDAAFETKIRGMGLGIGTELSFTVQSDDAKDQSAQEAVRAAEMAKATLQPELARIAAYGAAGEAIARGLGAAVGRGIREARVVDANSTADDSGAAVGSTGGAAAATSTATSRPQPSATPAAPPQPQSTTPVQGNPGRPPKPKK